LVFYVFNWKREKRALPHCFIADWDATVNTRYGHQRDAATGHPGNMQKISGSILSGDAFRHRNVIIKNGACQKHWEFDSRLLTCLDKIELKTS